MTAQTDIEVLITKLIQMKSQLNDQNFQRESRVLEIFRGLTGEIGCEVEDAENAISDLEDSKFSALHIEAQGFLRGLIYAFDLANEAFERAEKQFNGED